MTRAEKAQKMTVQDGGNRALQSRFFAKKEETEGVSAGKTRAGGPFPTVPIEKAVFQPFGVQTS
jgi:hypothetical protein